MKKALLAVMVLLLLLLLVLSGCTSKGNEAGSKEIHILNIFLYQVKMQRMFWTL